ncbi:MAG TPA: aminomethyl-transferring glycine dehydrogenase subunit GcvPA [Steroidobacteraceae bacterium]|jgi:glycine dehydrogenase subunit 1|nr:aminomethyl-transferring glycine dehydrogenase subunit GcvPA [Steroidobacteraceae bacterium]
MPFIPHTPEDVEQMLAAIGAKKIDDLFDEIPKELRIQSLAGIPDALNEMQIGRLMAARAAQDGTPLNFIGAGAYEHHIPSAVWAITSRGEFYSAYTPYQAEASQGTLQLIYEYQTMITQLTGMDVSNASLYDGGSAVAEASLMAIRAHRRSKSQRLLVPTSLHPNYRKVAVATASGQGVRFEEVPCPKGFLSVADLKKYEGEDFTALVIQQPNFFGALEDVDALTDWAHANNVLVIAAVNPISLGILKPPGEWGAKGADIACGDCQPMGVPLSSGGPYAGFLTTRMEFVRQMPGRIVGRTVDLNGKQGFALTLQAREQHIRRGKATSNICTNQGLLVTAATIYMSLLGAEGLARVANECHRATQELVAALTRVKGVKLAFERARFHEAVLLLDRPVAPVLAELARRGIVGGYDLSGDYPELGHALLVCATETRTAADIKAYADALAETLKAAVRAA